jgi:hypothetical protein
MAQSGRKAPSVAVVLFIPPVHAVEIFLRCGQLQAEELLLARPLWMRASGVAQHLTVPFEPRRHIPEV